MRNFLYAALTLGLLSCGGNGSEPSANQLAGNDFESIDGWMGETPPVSLTKERAHSGKYAIKVDPAVEYSMGYNNTLGKISASKLRKIKVKAWVNLPKGTTESTLVITLSDPAANNKQLLWSGTKVAEAAKEFDKWVEIEKEIVLPENVSYNHRFGVYLWRTAAPEKAFLDDLTIEKVE